MPGLLADASNVAATFIWTGCGDTVNDAVGAPAGGRITPVGTRRIITCSGLDVAKFVEVGVATIATQLPAEVEHATPPALLAGAVNTAVATPSLLVTTDRADNVPKSCTTPPTDISSRSGTPDSGFPSGPIARTLTDDCDPPSWLMLSGMALSVNDERQARRSSQRRRIRAFHGATGRDGQQRERDRRATEICKRHDPRNPQNYRTRLLIVPVT